MPRITACHAAFLACTLGLASRAGAQWTLRDFHPAGASLSSAMAMEGDQIVGYIEVGGRYHAVLWTDGGAAWVDLHPAGAYASRAMGVSGGVQSGYIERASDAVEKAALWRGTAESFTDLSQGWMAGSLVRVASGTVQGGYYRILPGRASACLWSGTAESLVNLEPPGTHNSWVSALDGEAQGGSRSRYEVDGRIEVCASLWKGTAESWVNLSPGARSSSEVVAIRGGEQFGFVELRACKWSGTPESRVDLHPQGAVYSGVSAVSDGVQLGWYADSGPMIAALWRGTADSMVNLEALLPRGYSNLWETAVWSDGAVIRVLGSAVPPMATARHAVMLTYTPPPSVVADFDGDGFLDFFDYDAFLACFEGGPCPGGRTADFNGDGFADFADYADFVAAFEAGT